MSNPQSYAALLESAAQAIIHDDHYVENMDGWNRDDWAYYFADVTRGVLPNKRYGCDNE